MIKKVETVAPDALYRRCNPGQFSFASTAELEAKLYIIGQERAIESVRFGVGMQQEGYNLFALGPQGMGKHSAVTQYLQKKAANEATPPDYCYVYNFKQAHQPHLLHLPAGTGTALRQDMENLVEELFAVLPAAFESEDYQSQRQTIGEELQQQQEATLETLNQRAQEQNIALIRTPAGLAFAPVHNGDVISPEEFQQLDEAEREQIQEKVADLQKELQQIMRQVPQWSRQIREKLKELNQEVVTFTVTPLIEELRQKYAQFEAVDNYLQGLQADITENVDKFLHSQGEGQEQVIQTMLGQVSGGGENWPSPSSPFFNRYKVNVLVDHSQSEGAPVVYETHPTYHNLIGRIEHMAQMGALFTDFTLIKPGALHKANGGYLILDVRNVLLQPYAWESLKRALQAGEIRIESLGQTLGLISTISVEPEPIPLAVKIVLLGERQIYYLLYHLDPDFRELFKVTVDFEDEMPRSAENNRSYAELIASLVARDDLRHFRPDAVARVIEHSSRLMGDAEKLSTHMRTIADLIREASFWADENGNGQVHAEDVQKAIDAQNYRNGRIRERVQEAILRETILIDTTGIKVGQINGLSVMQIGNATFGRPSCITARVKLGKGEVVDIERQVEMGGPLHSKGVLILAGFLGARYAIERPLSLSASLVFEQSYGGIDGDSASSAELYALLSALSNVPIKQSLAVTGSVNQHGQVQAIGGVNEKIEGFFDICEARGLTGEQGVLIPQANVKNLMLRQDVVEAVANGQFAVYPIVNIDQGIEILTGVAAGEADNEGQYSADSINGRISQRLKMLAEKLRDFNKSVQDGDNE
jgi:lon-related putative ATP-dependent protease